MCSKRSSEVVGAVQEVLCVLTEIDDDAYRIVEGDGLGQNQSDAEGDKNADAKS